MGFFSVPRLPGWSFQHPSTSHFKKVHRLFEGGENRRVFKRSRYDSYVCIRSHMHFTLQATGNTIPGDLIYNPGNRK
ncbi:MAG: hypothetical protein ACQEQO_09330 [Thermodesulfobacteriota bacterium]